MSLVVGEDWQSVGARIREARASEGISVRELARRVGISASHVSQVERGRSSFSASVLYSVASELGISLDQLFELPGTDNGRESRYDDGSVIDDLVLRRANRRTIKLAGGPRWERLTPHPDRNGEFLEVVYSPRTDELNDSGLVRHEGREYGVVLVGAIHVQVGFDSTILEAGDSIVFDSMLPHRFQNSVDIETRAIWFVAGTAARPGAGAAPSDLHSACHSV